MKVDPIKLYAPLTVVHPPRQTDGHQWQQGSDARVAVVDGSVLRAAVSHDVRDRRADRAAAMSWGARMNDRIDRLPGGVTVGLCVAVIYLALKGL